MQQRTVLVTGGGSGIGKEVVKRFYAASYNVVVVSLLEEELTQLTTELASNMVNNSLHTLALDLTRDNAAQQVANYCDDLAVDIDILINNAGFGLHGKHSDAQPQQLDAMLKLNIIAVSSLCHVFANRMRQQSSPHPAVIINIGSTTAFQPLPMLAAYAASKSFVVSFSEALAQELEPENIEVHCVCPGTTKTPFLDVAGLAEQSSTFGSTAYIAHKIAMPPSAVAEQVYACIGSKRTTSVPGIVNQLHYELMSWLPKRLLQPVVNRILNR